MFILWAGFVATTEMPLHFNAQLKNTFFLWILSTDPDMGNHREINLLSEEYSLNRLQVHKPRVQIRCPRTLIPCRGSLPSFFRNNDTFPAKSAFSILAVGGFTFGAPEHSSHAEVFPKSFLRVSSERVRSWRNLVVKTGATIRLIWAQRFGIRKQPSQGHTFESFACGMGPPSLSLSAPSY
ncbi:hypothetical protein CEXT_34981 [Caerostris extrusa]|uniref:Uncharacterized protein n=1 Tax=Caerostris extrusa TaxID=172846 RepID=A0AAV4SKG3_CAEEX|nr:hypothetical protein CEXT_34981 [Caerostris extrusa]